MEKFRSLAEALGTLPPSGDADAPRLEDITDSKAFAHAVLASREFRQYIVNGLTLGDLPAAIVTRLMDYGWGKPAERIEVSDVTAVETLTAAQLDERAARLAEMARFLRRAEEFDEPLTSDSVH